MSNVQFTEETLEKAIKDIQEFSKRVGRIDPYMEVVPGRAKRELVVNNKIISQIRSLFSEDITDKEIREMIIQYIENKTK